MDNETDELAAWLVLLRTEQLGAARVRALVERFGSASAALAQRGHGWREIGIEPGVTRATASRGSAQGVDGDLEWLRGADRALLRFTDDDWPDLLESIADPPAALFVQGRANCLWQPQIAIVGSRKATRGGLDLAREFAEGLVDRGLTVTSGLARGIDEAAHAAALAAGGLTIAVCGTGLDVEYPRGSASLARAIARQGMLVSEHGTGAAPLAAHFPRRNRLISGLSLGTLVIEAGLKSGSLITARLAAEQGREVFAVPGSIRNPLARGCHALIRDGAHLVETAKDICDAIAPMAAELASAIGARLQAHSNASPLQDAAIPRRAGSPDIVACEVVRISRTAAIHATPAPADVGVADPRAHVEHTPRTPQEAPPDALLEAIGFDPVALENLFGVVDLEPAAVSARLMTLELTGFVEALPGARYVRLR